MFSVLSTDLFFINGIRQLIKKIPVELYKRMPCNGEVCIVDVSSVDDLTLLKKKKFCHFIFVLSNKNVMGVVPNLKDITFDYSVISRNDTREDFSRNMLATLLFVIKGRCLMKGVSSPKKSKITPREIQVVNYASKGIDVYRMGKLLSISQKGVYALKRCFMVKIDSCGIAKLYFAVVEINVISTVISIQKTEGGGEHTETFYCRSISSQLKQISENYS